MEAKKTIIRDEYIYSFEEFLSLLHLKGKLQNVIIKGLDQERVHVILENEAVN